jgi:hypothetical protein
MRNRLYTAIGYSYLVWMLSLVPAHAQAPELPPCGAERRTSIVLPWSGSGDLWCLERVLDAPDTSDAIGFTQIAVDTDENLYAIAPVRGELVRIADTDDDALPDTPTVLVGGLPYPTGMTVADDNAYIMAGTTLYQYDIRQDTLTVLTDELPHRWDGYPNRALYVHEGMLYVGVGGSTACADGRGDVYRFNLVTQEQETVATGLIGISGITAHQGQLYVTDAHTHTVWALISGTDYGGCTDNTPDVWSYTLPTGSAPTALASYTDALFPLAENRLLVVLEGTVGTVSISGYQVVGLDTTVTDNALEAILPRNSPHLGLSDQRMHIQGSGFYPHHVYGVAVSQQGWIYVSAGNGKIVALRPL